ncbi:Iron-binding protein IscA [Candidatus Cyrtobacter comes]|uniref:Iron-binding protein IscA n=1 Tax=Candidatus Cyrtobacter comes TaxID=675776 RepID=A0ABU5L801_9RICK|nr:iron-sulfur cluster assembly accessory protein [Candidatus Cyrtobacter comes]MDZ5762251.1 Iron-binding protein IscA [Candidatus Cyrtobacter comes]
MKSSIISLSDLAIKKVRELLAKDEKAIGLKVGVKSGGCSGLSYEFAYMYEHDPKYEKVVCADISIFIEPSAVMHILGTVMDYTGDKFSSSFIFTNPNAISQCGCGKSFSTKSAN